MDREIGRILKRVVHQLEEAAAHDLSQNGPPFLAEGSPRRPRKTLAVAVRLAIVAAVITAGVRIAGDSPQPLSGDATRPPIERILGCEAPPLRTAPADLKVELQLPTKVWTSHEAAEFTIAVTNTGNAPIKNHRARQAVDFWVEGGSGFIAKWSYQPNSALHDVLVREVFDPGEAKRRTVTWSVRDCEGRPLQPGRYVARGLWWSGQSWDDFGGWATSPVEFTIGG